MTASLEQCGVAAAGTESTTAAQRPTEEVTRQFDVGIKEFVLYRVEIFLQKVNPEDEEERVPLADVVVARKARDRFRRDTEHWYFFDEGVANLHNATRLQISGGPMRSWSEIDAVFSERVEGRSDIASELPAKVCFQPADDTETSGDNGDNAGTSGAPPSPTGCVCFEHADVEKDVRVRLHLRIAKERGTWVGEMTWLRNHDADAYVAHPDCSLLLQTTTPDVPAGRWWWWGGSVG